MNHAQATPTQKSIFAGFLTLIGIGLISLNQSGFSIGFGELLTLGFSVLYSFILVLTGIVSRKANPISMSFFQFAATCIMCAMAALLSHSLPTSYPLAGIAAIAYLIIINTVVGYILQNTAQKYTSDTHAALLLSTESVIVYFCGVVL